MSEKEIKQLISTANARLQEAKEYVGKVERELKGEVESDE